MALVNGPEYDHIDLHSVAGGDVTRHMLKDAQARVTLSNNPFDGTLFSKANIDFQNGYYISDGTIEDSQNWKRALVSIVGKTASVLSMYGSTVSNATARICFFDGNSALLDNKQIYSGVHHYEIPSNTASIGLSIYASDSVLFYLNDGIISGLQDSVTGLQDSVTGLQDSVTGLQDSVTGLRGAITPAVDYSVFEKDATAPARIYSFDVKAGTTYLVSNLLGDSTVGVRTCLSDGTAIEVIKTGIAVGETVVFNATIDAEYIRVYSVAAKTIVSVCSEGYYLKQTEARTEVLQGKVKNIGKHLETSYLGMKQFVFPESFGMDSPVKVYSDGYHYITDFVPEEHKNQGGAVWYVAPVTVVNADGRSEKSPVSFSYAYTHCAAGDTIVLKEGIYDRDHSGYVWTNVIRKSINIIGNNAIILDGNFTEFTKLAGYEYVYSTTRSLAKRVIDVSIPGQYIPYVSVSSIQEVESTSGSYYIDGNTVYVHSINGQNPTAAVFVALNYEKTLDIDNNDGDVNVYVENITLVGKFSGVLIDKKSTTNSLDVCFNGVTTILCGDASSSNDSFMVYGGNVIFNKCKAISSYKDGYNYSGRNKDGTACDCHCTEIDCIGAGSGHESSEHNMNGSTAHQGAKIIRINGKYYDCNGGNVADVQTGTQSVNLGCMAYTPYCTDNYSQNFTAQQSGTEMWLDGCIAVGAKFDIFCAADSAVYANNVAYDTISIYQAGTFEETHKRVVSELMLLKGLVFGME